MGDRPSGAGSVAPLKAQRGGAVEPCSLTHLGYPQLGAVPQGPGGHRQPVCTPALAGESLVSVPATLSCEAPACSCLPHTPAPLSACGTHFTRCRKKTVEGLQFVCSSVVVCRSVQETHALCFDHGTSMHTPPLVPACTPCSTNNHRSIMCRNAFPSRWTQLGACLSPMFAVDVAQHLTLRTRSTILRVASGSSLCHMPV